MTHESLTRVLVERERLYARIEAQRRDTSRYVSGLARAAVGVDGVRHAIRFVRTHPQVIVAGVVAVFVLRARSMLGLLTRAHGLWRLGRQARALLRYVRY